MDRKVQKIIRPEYKKIYSDLIRLKYPEKKDECDIILLKKSLSRLDFIALNNIISSNNAESISSNQKHRAYDKETVLQILDYQNKNKLNNKQTANHFKLSRNTIAAWKKRFLL